MFLRHFCIFSLEYLLITAHFCIFSLEYLLITATFLHIFPRISAHLGHKILNSRNSELRLRAHSSNSVENEKVKSRNLAAKNHGGLRNRKNLSDLRFYLKLYFCENLCVVWLVMLTWGKIQNTIWTTVNQNGEFKRRNL